MRNAGGFLESRSQSGNSTALAHSQHGQHGPGLGQHSQPPHALSGSIGLGFGGIGTGTGSPTPQRSPAAFHDLLTTAPAEPAAQAPVQRIRSEIGLAVTHLYHAESLLQALPRASEHHDVL